MKIKLDENLPSRLVEFLSKQGHNTDTVPQEGLTGCPDDRVWTATQKAGRFLITQDLDFSDLRKYLPGTHCGILLLRLRDPGRVALAERVQAIFEAEPVDQWSGCFVVATERKIRVRFPAPHKQ